MNGLSRVLVAAGSETVALRLRLMIEAEGAEAAVLGRDDPAGSRLVVVAPALKAQAAAAAPGIPMIELVHDEDWEVLRRRLAQALAQPPAAEGCSNGTVANGSESEALAAALAQARILLVDDSVTFREYLRQELARQGAMVAVCGNADDALARLATEDWDCVLIDLVLPGMDGAEMCRRAARLRRDGRGTFVLGIMSSREGKADLIRSLEAGADLFLGKAQDPVLIRAKLGAVLRRRTVMG